MSNKVIVTADDYGVCDRIDNAILAAIDKKKLTAVSVMVTHDGWEKRLDRLIEKLKNHKFGIGLHLSITSGVPRANNPYSSLVSPGDEKRQFMVIKNYNFKQVLASDLRDEIRAQYKLLHDHLKNGYQNKAEADIPDAFKNIPVDHMTNHHGVVYFDTDLYRTYVDVAREKKLPIRSPMSWYRKFKGISELPDYEGTNITNPTMRRGVKIGMWRRLGQMSYGNFLKRMNSAEHVRVDYPDVLCEYIYGQCKPEKNKGKEVLDHVLDHFKDYVEGTDKNDGKLIDRSDVSFKAIKIANEKTRDESLRAAEPPLGYVNSRYDLKVRNREFSMELMFHLGINENIQDGFTEKDPPHGINGDYFEKRDGEWQMLREYDFKTEQADRKIQLITFQEL